MMTDDTAGPADGLMSIAELAEAICQEMGFGRSPDARDATEFGWQVTSTQNIIIRRAEAGEVCLYRADRPFPFGFGGLDEPHSDLRLNAADVEKVRGWFQRAEQPEPERSAPAADKRSTPSLPTSDVAHCFAGLRWNEVEWRRILGKQPAWLKRSVVRPGQRGRREIEWDPVFVGSALVRHERAAVKVNQVRARFQTIAKLAPWRDQWRDHETEYFPSE